METLKNDLTDSHNYKMSRPVFADVLGVSESLVRKWERLGLSPELVPRGSSSRPQFTVAHVVEARKRFRPLPPHSTRTLLFWLLKGGVGKTTISFNLAGALSRMGYRVLAVDLDGQSHLTTCFGVSLDDQEQVKTLYNLFYDEGPSAIKSITEAIVPLSPTLDLLPASLDVAAVDLLLVGEQEPARKFLRLQHVLQEIKSHYDFVILDAPPNINLLVLNAFFAADEVIAPMLTDFLSHHSLTLLADTVRSITESFQARGYDSPTIKILANHFDMRNNLCRESLGLLQSGAFKEHILNSVIRLSTALSESTKNMQPVFTFAPKSHGAEDILALAREIAIPPSKTGA